MRPPRKFVRFFSSWHSPPEYYLSSCSKSRLIPLRYASPFEMSWAVQYASSLRSVSASVLTLYLISLGLSAFGLPVFFKSTTASVLLLFWHLPPYSPRLPDCNLIIVYVWRKINHLTRVSDNFNQILYWYQFSAPATKLPLLQARSYPRRNVKQCRLVCTYRKIRRYKGFQPVIQV